MRKKSNIKECNLHVVTLLILSMICYQSGFATEITSDKNSCATSINIPLGGDWNGKSIKSLPTPLPLTAYTDGYYYLTIQNQSPNCDINIDITNQYGVTVYTDKVPAVETAYIVIPIDALPAGEYTLELRNASDGYLYGTFAKYDTGSLF